MDERLFFLKFFAKAREGNDEACDGDIFFGEFLHFRSNAVGVATHIHISICKRKRCLNFTKHNISYNRLNFDHYKILTDLTNCVKYKINVKKINITY